MRRIPMFLAALGLGFGLLATTASAGPVNRLLGQRLPELKFQGVTLADAIDFIRDVSGANIVVNWKALEAANVSRDTQVNVHLNAISLRKALDIVLSEAGGGEALTFDIDDGVVEITTREIADHRMITRVYPVEDLIMVVPDFTDAPQFSLEAAQNAGSGGGGSSGGGAGGGAQTTLANTLFQTGTQTQTSEPVKTKAERAQDLVDLIEATVFTDIWKENGGTASIRYFNGNLVVTAPRSVQEAIGGEYN